MDSFVPVCLLVTVLTLHSTHCQATNPCSNASPITDTSRAVDNPAGAKPSCDDKSYDPDKWYYFTSSGKSASIPTDCIQNDRCGTQVGMHVNLDGQKLPSAEGENVTASLCGSYNVLGKYDCCVLRTSVEIAWCSGDRLIYRFPQPFDRCPVAVCVVEHRTTPPPHVIVQHGETFGKKNSTEEPEETEDPGIFEDQPVQSDDDDEKDSSDPTDKELSTTTVELQESSTTTVTTSSSGSSPLPELSTVQATSTLDSSDSTQAASATNQSTTELSSLSAQPHSMPTTQGEPVTISSTDSQTSTLDSVSTSLTSVDIYTSPDPADTSNTTVSEDPGIRASTISVSTQGGETMSNESTVSTLESDSVTQASSTTTDSLFNTTSSSPESSTVAIESTPSAHTQSSDDVNSTASTISERTTSIVSITDAVSPSASSSSPDPDVSEHSTTDVDVHSQSDTSTRALISETSDSQTSPQTPSAINTTLPAGEHGTTGTSTEGSTTLMIPPSYAISTRRPTTTPTTSASTSLTTFSTTDSTSPGNTREITSGAPSSAVDTTSQPVVVNSSSGPQTSTTTSSQISSSSSSPSLTEESSSEIPKTPFPTPSSQPTPTSSYNEDVILEEKVRLVFQENYENDTIFENEVKNTLNKFLHGATRLQKSKAGTDWWFELDVIGQAELYQNQSTLLDFRIRHTSGEEILETFKRYQLKKYFKEKVNLNLLATCRPSENCQESGPVSASTSGSHFWAEHAPVFITVIVLSAAIFLVLMLGLLGGKCRDRWWRTGTYNAARDDYEVYDTKPLSEQTKLRPVSGVSGGLSSPFPDETITKNETGEDCNEIDQGTAFLTDTDNTNGDVDNDTWVIPLEEAPNHHSNGHSRPLTTSAPTASADNSATTTVQGRDDAFVSTQF